MKNLGLYTVTVLIWGSTWIFIKLQLGVVDPVLSVAYRVTLASIILIGYCKLRGLNLRFSLRQHMFIALQGAFLFSINYLLVYMAELYLTSGLVAVLFSTLVFMNVIVGAAALGTPVRGHVVFGALLGMVGIALVYLPELNAFNLQDSGFLGLLLGVGGVVVASFGNITSARNQRAGLPVVQTNALGMGYGGLLMFIYALIRGIAFDISLSVPYIGALLYLAIFGSILAFGAYLTLLGRIGADRAAYATLLFPIIALGISTLFEGYQWNGLALLGTVLVLAGNFLVLFWRKDSSQELSAPTETAAHAESS
ncbi:MAG: EamA family transporter [Chloroflexi bacterium]|nr:EamA family transporter [Chloroflexota bacterium]